MQQQLRLIKFRIIKYLPHKEYNSNSGNHKDGKTKSAGSKKMMRIFLLGFVMMASAINVTSSSQPKQSDSTHGSKDSMHQSSNPKKENQREMKFKLKEIKCPKPLI